MKLRFGNLALNFNPIDPDTDCLGNGLTKAKGPKDASHGVQYLQMDHPAADADGGPHLGRPGRMIKFFSK
jgi:hypothetical protein